MAPGTPYRGPNDFSLNTNMPEYSPAELEDTTLNDILDEGDLKYAINNFIWMHAPAMMPIGEADKLACRIFESLVDAREKYAVKDTSAGD